ncbi:hypothetical protein WT37_04410 [Burkholderia territorii]|nr:hypothetical protein WT37_04410 [Burkholderia territorii]
MFLQKLRYVSSEDVDSLDKRCAPSLTESMIAWESIILIMRQLDQMSLALQQTFECLFVYGMQYQEAADELSVPIGTIRSRVARIRVLLTKDSVGSA